MHLAADAARAALASLDSGGGWGQKGNNRHAKEAPMIELTGFLRCASAAEAARVHALLPAHVALTRAEAGCLRFEVTPEADGLTWRVFEQFTDQAAFDAHQARAGASDWAAGTAGIARDYQIRETT